MQIINTELFTTTEIFLNVLHSHIFDDPFFTKRWISFGRDGAAIYAWKDKGRGSPTCKWLPKIKAWQYTNHRWHLAVVPDILLLYHT